jgi:hypothetical protein
MVLKPGKLKNIMSASHAASTLSEKQEDKWADAEGANNEGNFFIIIITHCRGN